MRTVFLSSLVWLTGCFMGTDYPDKTALIDQVAGTSSHPEAFAHVHEYVEGLTLEQTEFWKVGSENANPLVPAYYEVVRQCGYAYETPAFGFGGKRGMLDDTTVLCSEVWPSVEEVREELLGNMLSAYDLAGYSTSEEVELSSWLASAEMVGNHWNNVLRAAAADQLGMISECITSENAVRDAAFSKVVEHASGDGTKLAGMDSEFTEMVADLAEMMAQCDAYMTLGDEEVAAVEASIQSKLEEARQLLERKRASLNSMPNPGCAVEAMSLPGVGDLPSSNTFTVGKQGVAYVVSGMAGEKVQIDLAGVGGNTDPVLSVYNADCSTRLARSDDYRGRNSRVTLTVEEDGPYVMIAQSYNGRSGQMTLTLTSEGGVPAETLAAAETFVGWAGSRVGVRADAEAEKVRQDELMQIAQSQAMGRACLVTSVFGDGSLIAESSSWKEVVNECMAQMGTWAEAVVNVND
jgi:hypothetical protein